MRIFVAATTLGVAAAAVVALARLPRNGSTAASASLIQGKDYLSALRHRLERPRLPAQPLASIRQDALQALYLARIEAGLGSPFRTVEAALRDPLLSDSIRTVFASALLAQALDLAPPAVGALALDSVTATVVDSVVRVQAEPRRGEEIVRVAFELAAASGAVSQPEAAAAVEFAAVARDAAYARRDVARLVGAAHKGGMSPLDLLPNWRAERRFQVEEPVVYATAYASSRDLVAKAAALFDMLDTSAGERRSFAAADSQRREARDVAVTVRQAARRLAIERGAPPSPAILQMASGVPLGRLVPPASNEEELAAAWLVVHSLTRSEQRIWARAIVSTAVRLRIVAQDAVWFAGDHVPRVIELQERHGLRAITFPAGFRPAWRDYALQAVDRALTDARRVFPDLDLRGLRIHVGVKADWPARAMALHDPDSRTIYFPLVSAPGVLAHELGHDLDWQVARSVFGESGIYATDGTARRASELLAAPVERLTGASAAGRSKSARHSAATRPTEVLARHVDWIVAAALASMGRSNGFLSTIQDGGDALGNTTAPAPDQVDAAVSVIAAATRVPTRTVAEVLAGAARAPLVREAVARGLATNIRMPWSRRAVSPFDALGAAPAMLRQAADPRQARRCLADAARAAGEPEWIGDVHALVADARSRDVMRRLQQSSPLARRASTNALRAGLGTGPVDPALRDRSLEQLRRDIEWQLAAASVTPLAQASAVPVCTG
ncbi:MAG: hypothetical protein ACT4P6_05185 [Gemmatimonadaceae bacterium]